MAARTPSDRSTTPSTAEARSSLVQLPDSPSSSTDYMHAGPIFLTRCDDADSQTNFTQSTITVAPITYNQCCLYENKTVESCAQSSHRHPDWQRTCITFDQLSQNDIRPYLQSNAIISNIQDDTVIMNEKNLIANRLIGKKVYVDDSMFICPKHRSTFGIDWISKKSTCHHPEHGSNSKSSKSDCRQVKLTTCSSIKDFPVGGRLCSKHRKLLSLIDKKIDDSTNDNDDDDAASTTSSSSDDSEESSFDIEDQRTKMNRILAEIDISPVKSQTTKPLEDQSEGSIRRLTSKLNRATSAFQNQIANILVPGEAEQLIARAAASGHSNAAAAATQHPRQQLDQTINNEMVENLRHVYDLYVKQKIPFEEQVRLLALLPRASPYKTIMELFGCSRHAIKAAHRMYDDEEYLLNKSTEPAIRQRADPDKIKHFVSWLVESNILISGTYGLTTLRLDNGQKYDLPKQIIQSRRTHAIVQYQKYCEETDFQSLQKSKLYDIINSIKPAQQKAVTGLDVFVVEGVEAWQSLSDIVSRMPIPQDDRKRILKQIDMAEQYQKITHIGHCSDNADCVTHCTTFALSDPACAQHRSDCNHTHTSHCSDCVNLVMTLDEIGQKISQTLIDDIQREAKFDFENALQHIIEWSRHNIRAARQDAEKKTILSHMQADEAFCTFDWGQKILPQQHREGQSTYFGKRGMSILVGSFLWKDPSCTHMTTAAVATTTTTTTTDTVSSQTTTYSTKSYIVALTDAAQTELDTLSAGEIITKQFHGDHPHIKKLHKRTDNASNFSSHSTPEIERVICERVGIQLVTRDFSEVQKGKDICDRICGVAKARMRSWMAMGHDLVNATDVKEGMEYAGGIANTQVAVAEIIPNTGRLDKTKVPNISTIRSIHYDPNSMLVFKASGVGAGLSVPYARLHYEGNMRVTSPFGQPIDNQTPHAPSKPRPDRKHHYLLFCPVSGCTATFKQSTDLDSHIASNQHLVQKNEQPRTANDTARAHLTELIRTGHTAEQAQRTTILHGRSSLSHADLTNSAHYESFSSPGWALRTRKHTTQMPDKVKQFIEKLWLDSQKIGSKLTAEQIQQEIRTKKQADGEKLFAIHEYPTLNQIKYRCRKISQTYDMTPKTQLIIELTEQNTEKS